MTLGAFIIGILLMTSGFFIVWKTQLFLQWFGDLGEAFGAVGIPWMSWKLFGVILLFLGFFIAFGIFGALFEVTIGRFFFFGNLP